MNTILKVNKESCLGCGLCALACPQRAIFEVMAISAVELRTTIPNLKQQTDAIMRRIDRLVSGA